VTPPLPGVALQQWYLVLFYPSVYAYLYNGNREGDYLATAQAVFPRFANPRPSG